LDYSPLLNITFIIEKQWSKGYMIEVAFAPLAVAIA
jgi:hypothetical protein